MKFSTILLVLILSAVTTVAVNHYLPAKAPQSQETAFDRVLRTNTLRCGYYTYTPVTIKDPNTGKLTGLSVDMMDYFSEKTGIKVEWTEEVTFGNWVQGLQAGRFDAVCTPVWPDIARARVTKFSKPFLYTDFLPIVRADDARFSDNLEDFNKSDITIGAMDGDTSLTIGKAAFPKAKFSVLPETGDYSVLLQELIEKKIDMVPWERNSAYQFNLRNPGKIKVVKTKEPLGLMPSELAVAPKERDLMDFLNALIEDMQNTGEMKRLLDKWVPVPGIVLYTAKPYDPDSYKPFTALDSAQRPQTP